MNKPNKKLYRVTLSGFERAKADDMTHDYRVGYVIARNAEQAYAKLLEVYEQLDRGHWRERGLKSVELLAEESFVTECENMLVVRPDKITKDFRE